MGALIGVVSDLQLIASNQSIIYFLGLPHSVFFNILIHADFENFHSVVEEAFSVVRVMHIAYRLEQKQAVITVDEMRFIGLIFPFLVRVKEILKSTLCLTCEKLFVWSVFRSLSELTTIAIETFSSKTAVLLYDVNKNTSTCSQQSQRKNNGISLSSQKIYSSQEKQSIVCLKNDFDCRLAVQFSIVISCCSFSLSYNSDL